MNETMAEIIPNYNSPNNNNKIKKLMTVDRNTSNETTKNKNNSTDKAMTKETMSENRLATLGCSSYKDGRMNVRDFYRGRKVFVTGATGFLGKVLIERLLRQLDVDTIYVLVREKKGKSIHSRIEEMTDDVYYDTLKVHDPKFKHKLVPMNGDCAVAGLGLSINDIQTLAENVEVVFHCAATVRFDERLDKSYAINVSGTKSVIHLCRQMKNLQAFLHVSTAYSNCHVQHIEEKFYDYALSADEVSAILSKLSTEEIVARTPDIIQKWPNTYTFTKALAENVIRVECDTLPTAVFRPAIIMSTYNGATPGWIDNLYGPVGATASIYAGFTRVVKFAEDNSCNIVPVDKVADGVLAAAWEVGTRPNSSAEAKHIKIYNYVSSSTANNITWREYVNLGLMYAEEYPSMKAKRDMALTVVHNSVVYNFFNVMYHYLPAIIIDFVLILSGNKPRLFNWYKKLNTHMVAVLFFVGTYWSFAVSNVQQLHTMLTHEDKVVLPLSILDINWTSYLRSYMLGVRRYLLKEDDSTIPAAIKRQSKMASINIMIRYVFLFFLAHYFYAWFCSATARLLFNS